MDTDTKIQRVVADAVQAHIFPGAVVGYIRDNETKVLPFGHLTYDDDSGEVTAETVYDVASLTKVIPTDSIILSLIEQGLLSLDDRAATYIPELANKGKAEIRIWHLLTYTAVFHQSHRLSYYAQRGKNVILRSIYDAPLEYPVGVHYGYSNIPPLLLGMIAETVLKRPLDDIADRMFFRPLQMHSTTFHPEKLRSAAIAPAEMHGTKKIVGRVHDESAYAFHRAGMSVGQAGVFSTTGDLLKFGQMLLNGGQLDGQQYFKSATVKEMSTEAFHDGQRGTSLGWTTAHPGYFDPHYPPHTFGKDGFTGTLMLLNPDKKRCVVILSNQTFPKRPDTTEPNNKVRRALADIILS